MAGIHLSLHFITKLSTLKKWTPGFFCVPFGFLVLGIFVYRNFATAKSSCLLKGKQTVSYQLTIS